MELQQLREATSERYALAGQPEMSGKGLTFVDSIEQDAHKAVMR